MSQDTEQVARPTQGERLSTETAPRQETRQRGALPPLVHWLIPVVTGIDLTAMSLIALNGWTSLFAFTYVGVLLTYVFGGLYLIKKLIDHRGRMSYRD